MGFLSQALPVVIDLPSAPDFSSVPSYIPFGGKKSLWSTTRETIGRSCFIPTRYVPTKKCFIPSLPIEDIFTTVGLLIRNLVPEIMDIELLIVSIVIFLSFSTLIFNSMDLE